MALEQNSSEYDVAGEGLVGTVDLDGFWPIQQNDAYTHPRYKIPRRDDDGHEKHPWRTLGTRAVPSSLPLANMVSAVPDFDPVIEGLDDQPRFLKALPSHLPPEDIDYLNSKGALTIPDPPLRNELLRAYVKWVCHFMPLLDLHGFLRAVAENDPDANLSLLLFQAVMFAGTAFVDVEHLQAAGFATRMEARRAFFLRVRLLYSFDYEDDRIAIIQAILLMTYWHEVDSSPQQDIWHWVGVCNTQAQSIGLHRDPTRSEMDADTRRLRIRLWWSLYSRDRLVALALRRPTQINEGICDVPVLRLSDFDIRPFHPAVVRMLQYEEMGDLTRQRRLAIMFVEKVKLCQCLGRVLFAQYSPSHHSFGAAHKTTITLIPRQASEAELDRCSQKLETWFRSLSTEAQFTAPKSQTDDQGDHVVLLHAAMLRMIYHATCTSLHRPRALLSSSKKPASTPSVRASLRKMQDAASGTADIVHDLNRLGLTRFLPTSSLTVVTPAAVVHLTNLTSANPALRDESAWNFRRCVNALDELKDMYPAADFESACLEKAARYQCGQTPISNNTILVMPGGFLDLMDRNFQGRDDVMEFDLDDLMGEADNVAGNLSGDVDWNGNAIDDCWLLNSDDGDHQGQTPSYAMEAQAISLDSIVHDGMTGDFRTAESPRFSFGSDSFASQAITLPLTGDLDLDLDLGFV